MTLVGLVDNVDTRMFLAGAGVGRWYANAAEADPAGAVVVLHFNQNGDDGDVLEAGAATRAFVEGWSDQPLSMTPYSSYFSYGKRHKAIVSGVIVTSGGIVPDKFCEDMRNTLMTWRGRDFANRFRGLSASQFVQIIKGLPPGERDSEESLLRALFGTGIEDVALSFLVACQSALWTHFQLTACAGAEGLEEEVLRHLLEPSSELGIQNVDVATTPGSHEQALDTCEVPRVSQYGSDGQEFDVRAMRTVIPVESGEAPPAALATEASMTAPEVDTSVGLAAETSTGLATSDEANDQFLQWWRNRTEIGLLMDHVPLREIFEKLRGHALNRRENAFFDSLVEVSGRLLGS